MSSTDRSGQEPASGEPPAAQRVSAVELLRVFAVISLSGFGGTLFWVRRVVVEQRRWMSSKQFLEEMALCQILPGPNIFNLIVMIGHRFDGVRGAFAGVLGFILPPFLIVIASGVLYQHYGGMEVVQRALSGMTAVAIGLVLANAVKLGAVLPRAFRSGLFVALGFAGLGLARLPLFTLLLILAPLAVWFAWREQGVAETADRDAAGKGGGDTGKDR